MVGGPNTHTQTTILDTRSNQGGPWMTGCLKLEKGGGGWQTHSILVHDKF